MPQWTCLVCDPPAVIPYDRRASSTAVWRGHCARVHPDGTTPQPKGLPDMRPSIRARNRGNKRVNTHPPRGRDA